MPSGDRSGPEGKGPMTGRGRGYCAGYDRPGYASNARPLRRFRRFRTGLGPMRRGRRYFPRDLEEPE